MRAKIFYMYHRFSSVMDDAATEFFAHSVTKNVWGPRTNVIIREYYRCSSSTKAKRFRGGEGGSSSCGAIKKVVGVDGESP